MRAAPAFQSGQRILDLFVGRLLVVAQECGGRHEPAIDAIAALRHLLLDVSGLQRMRLVRGAQSGERCDFAIADRRERRDAGADRLTVKMHGAGAALRQPAAKMQIIQTESVAQRVKQRHVRIGGDGMGASVYAE